MDYALGIDLGASRIKLMALGPSNATLYSGQMDTHDAETAPWVTTLRRAVKKLVTSFGPPNTIGLPAPGLASPDARSIAWMPGRMQRLEKLDWTTSLALGIPVRVLNDGHAALLGEVWRGAAIDARNVVMLTLGTGVGGAVMCDGRLLRGHIGRAGHLGHISLDPWGAPDITGTPGSLEDAIGNCTLAARSGGRYSETVQLATAAKYRNDNAPEIWKRSIDALGAGIVSIINAFDPEVIVLGGGIAKADDLLFEPLNQYLDKHEWRPGGHRVTIRAAELGENAGALGAAWYGMNSGDTH